MHVQVTSEIFHQKEGEAEFINCWNLVKIF